MCSSFVFIIASPDRTSFEVRTTDDLVQTVWAFRRDKGLVSEIEQSLTELVWYKELDTPQDAIAECNTIKSWPTSWQRRLVETGNSDWLDLWPSLTAQPKIRISTAHIDVVADESSSSYPIYCLVEDQPTTLDGTPSLAGPILIRKQAS